MVEQDIPGTQASSGTPTSTPAHRAAGRLQQVLPPGYRVRVEDLPDDQDLLDTGALGPADPDGVASMRRRAPIIRVLAATAPDPARD